MKSLDSQKSVLDYTAKFQKALMNTQDFISVLSLRRAELENELLALIKQSKEPYIHIPTWQFMRVKIKIEALEDMLNELNFTNKSIEFSTERLNKVFNKD